MDSPHPQRLTYVAALALALSSSVAATAPVAEEEAAAPDARALFLEHCATCHGPEGAGDGVTELDRPARSFRDGGFSYGNTPEAIFRTLTGGIPGTPMPSFAALDEGARRALAAYVIELGPGLPPPPESTELVVRERPVVVRGMLPPLTSEAVLVTRGLALGYPTGQSFEYRTDDVRFLGVRQGRFVNRTDWIGRGGTPLEPLGQVVYTLEGGAPPAMFQKRREDSWDELRASFRGTWIRGAEGGLRYDLLDGEGRTLARVRESCGSASCSGFSGFRRRLELRELAAGETLHLRALDASPTPWTREGNAGFRQREDGRLEVYLTHGARGVALDPRGRLTLGLPAAAAPSVDPAAPRELRYTVLVSHEAHPRSVEESTQLFARVLEEVQP